MKYDYQTKRCRVEEAALENFRVRIRPLLLDQFGSLAEAARILEVSPAHVWNVSRGSVKPSLQMLLRICVCCGMTPNDVLGWRVRTTIDPVEYIEYAARRARAALKERDPEVRADKLDLIVRGLIDEDRVLRRMAGVEANLKASAPAECGEIVDKKE